MSLVASATKRFLTPFTGGSLLRTSRKMASYQDITIPVPWGHIAGRVSGPSDGEPLLMLHGLMDNCGSFSRIQPRLPVTYRCVNIDLPGHGHSSHLPAGMMYNFFKGLTYITLVRRHLGWTSFSLLGHSFGAGISLLYAACFPEAVRSLVALDPVMLTPLEHTHPDVTRVSLLGYTEKLDRQQQQTTASSEGLPYQQLRHRVMSHAGLTDTSAADALLERGCCPVTGDLTSADTAGPALYRLTSDPMHRVTALLQSLSCGQYATYLARLRCPLLMVLAEQGDRWGTPEHEAVILETCAAALGDRLEVVRVPGGHHVHLSDPDRVVPLVSQFLERLDAGDLQRSAAQSQHKAKV